MTTLMVKRVTGSNAPGAETMRTSDVAPGIHTEPERAPVPPGCPCAPIAPAIGVPAVEVKSLVPVTSFLKLVAPVGSANLKYASESASMPIWEYVGMTGIVSGGVSCWIIPLLITSGIFTGMALQMVPQMVSDWILVVR